MTPKNTTPQTSTSKSSTSAIDDTYVDAPTDASMTILSIDSLVEAQVSFMQQWLCQQAQPLALDAWRWLGEQPMSKYIKCTDLQHLITDWLLSTPMSEEMRTDIRDILHSVIYHPVNDNVPLSDLIDDTQVATLATYVGRHEQQRNVLIHTLIGNETFADLLTQTLYHAINDFMETTLDKAGGVGKLMKMGRSSFEKATNKNLDDKLQAYLHRNIKDLTRRAEANAQAHLSNDEVARLLTTGWARIKDQPISYIQTYLNADTQPSSIDHIEASIQQSYNRLRVSPYLHSLVAASVETWYANHQSDSIATIAASLYIDEQALEQLITALLPLIQDAIESSWLNSYIKQMLQSFYAQAHIKAQITEGIDI